MNRNEFIYGCLLWAGLFCMILAVGLGTVTKEGSFGLNELITIYGVLVVNYSNSMFGSKNRLDDKQ